MRGNKTFLAFLLRARGLNNQWRIQRRSQIEKLVVVSVRSNLQQKSSTLLSEPKFGLPQSIFPGLVRRWQLIIWRLNYTWLSFPPNQTSLDKKASKLFTQIRALGSLFVTTMFASRLGSWNWGAMNPGGGGTWVFFGWVFAARDSKLAPRSNKKFP